MEKKPRSHIGLVWSLGDRLNAQEAPSLAFEYTAWYTSCDGGNLVTYIEAKIKME